MGKVREKGGGSTCDARNPGEADSLKQHAQAAPNPLVLPVAVWLGLSTWIPGSSGVQNFWACVLSLLLPGCETLGKLLDLFEPQLFTNKKGMTLKFHLIGCWEN